MGKKIILISVIVLALAALFVYIWNVRTASEKSGAMVRKARKMAREYAPLKKTGREVYLKEKAPAQPPVTKKFSNPRVAIVIDDFGYNMTNVDEILAIKEPLTLSILPNLRYSGRVAEAARSKGKEIILHLPLEPKASNAAEEPDTIKSSMSDDEILTRLDSEMASVPGLRGVSNHMGSKLTEDRRAMTVILKRLKEKGLYFFDSLTSEKSVCRLIASELGVPFAARRKFLDNENDVDYIKKAMLNLRRYAFKNGQAIAVCHDRKNTAKVLGEMLPQLADDGIRFVSLSKMVK